MSTEQTPPKKLTKRKLRSKLRYDKFLRADSGMRFGEWMKTKWAKKWQEEVLL